MIDSASAERLIARAVEEGLVTEEQARDQAALGPAELRLIGLVHLGLLTPSAVRRLLDDASPGNGNGSGHAEERFVVGDLIGRGGMGQVYRAYDQRLQRAVALKLLKGDDPDQLGRFLREAQAQARVVHDHVCRVYEVGEVGGKPYIAMQLIEGQPLFVSDGEAAHLSPALREMTVDQRVRLMQKVAEGIHAAHREGLIHRDIKPSNVMLERGPDGDFRPYVLDFGLARELASSTVTSLGLAAGTPNFMAPEQARGDAGALDRRTDVYGLGATLYAILSGRPPFEGPSSLDVLIKVTEQEAPPLTELPADLQTIVTKALQKEPSQRYESARAFAEDLGRYLDGEPILARRTSLVSRLAKKARKHKKLVAASAAALVAFLVLGTLSVRAQLRAQTQMRLAGLFGQEVKAVESVMRIAQLAPAHDLTPEKALVRERMASIHAQMQAIGSAAEGPGYYALGRGHLVLGEYEDARTFLERAWKAGYHGPEVAYALGQGLGALYQREMEVAARIRSKEQREARLRQIEKEYRDPALEYLQQGRGLRLESPEYVEGLIAFYEKRYDTAVEKAQAAYARVPWLYEAHALEARVWSTVGREKHAVGQIEAANQAYRQAEDAYRVAAEVGRSAPSVPEGISRLEARLMQMELYSEGANVEPHFRKGLEACDRALSLDPESVEAHLTKCNLLWRMGESLYRAGRDPRPLLGPSKQAGLQALRLHPQDANGYYGVGSAVEIQARYAFDHGEDPRPYLREAASHYQRSLAIQPNDENVWSSLSIIYGYASEYEDKHGRDPVPLLAKSEECGRIAVAVRPTAINLSNLSADYSDRARILMERGQDPTASLADAEHALDRALALNARYVTARNRWGEVHLQRALYRFLSAGEDPKDELAKATGAFESSVAMNPKYLPSLVGLARADWLRARFQRAHGRAPQPAIDAARAWVGKALAETPNEARALRVEARLHALEAESRVDRGLSPADAFDRAERAATRAITVEPDDPEAALILAGIHWQRARAQRRAHRSASAAIARGLALVEEQLGINPNLARALALRGVLLLEQAKIEPGRESLQRAFAINPLLKSEFGTALDEHRQRD
jgi:serine/threonine-protein kinase